MLVPAINPAQLDEALAARLRFEQTYILALVFMRQQGVTWESTSPAAEERPAVAPRTDWWWLAMSHPKTGLVGRLILLADGGVLGQGGERLTEGNLLDWLTWQLADFGARVRKENREKVADLERKNNRNFLLLRLSIVTSLVCAPLSIALSLQAGELIGSPEMWSWRLTSFLVLVVATLSIGTWAYCWLWARAVQRAKETPEYQEALRALTGSGVDKEVYQK